MADWEMEMGQGLQDRLIEATTRGDVGEVGRLLADEAYRQAIDDWSTEHAVLVGGPAIFQAYLDHGAAQYLDPSWFIDVLRGELTDRVEVAAMLVDAGVSLSDQDLALLQAVEAGSHPLIQATLAAGAPVDVTPFEVACILTETAKLTPEEKRITLESLLAHGFCQNKPGFDLLDATLSSCRDGAYLLAGQVLDAGADLFERDCEHFKRAIARFDLQCTLFLVGRCDMKGPDGAALPWRNWGPCKTVHDALTKAELSLRLTERVRQVDTMAPAAPGPTL